jgi:nicotinate-nucleotide--dimethylbenzimidazole phosphoribosyltransferase
MSDTSTRLASGTVAHDQADAARIAAVARDVRAAHATLERTLASIRPTDEGARRAALEHHARLTKPPGSLGRLEVLGAALAAIAGSCPPPVPRPAVVAVFAGDHGVLEEGVSPWPQDVTAQMVANFVAGGAAVNVLARQLHVAVEVIDVGVAKVLPSNAGVLVAKVRPGTANLAKQQAMTLDEARCALAVGAEVAAALVQRGFRCLLTGDMGIGNTTASAALVAAFAGSPPEAVTGRGTGIDDERMRLKLEVVRRALERTAEKLGEAATFVRAALDGSGVRAGEGQRASFDAGDAMPGPQGVIGVLASVGGLEHAAIAGYILGAAASRVPVVLDGVIAVASALVAAALAPEVVGYMVAGHRSTEPGASVGLARLGLEPVVDLALRLGEGTGACLALPAVEAAARVLGEMATFESAGVSGRHA